MASVVAALCTLLAVWAAGTGLRMLEMQSLSAESMRALGEPLMTTPDAYFWLAGAEGLGRAVGSPLSKAAGYVSRCCGLPLATIGLWAPVFLSGLAGVAVCFWAFTLGMGEFALLAGVLAGLAPGYVQRTRPGYFDSDMVTLSMTVFIAWTLAQGLGPWLFRSRITARDAEVGPGVGLLAWMAAAGLFGRFCAQWHVMLAVFVQLSFLLCLFGVLFYPSVHYRFALLLNCLFYALTAFLGTPGLLAAVAGIACLSLVGDWRTRLLGRARRVWPGICLLLLLLGPGGILRDGMKETAAYLQRARSKALTVVDKEVLPPAEGIVYPPMTETIVEGRPLSVLALPRLWHPWAGVALSGLVGFIVLLWRRPQAVLLAPLLVLALASAWLGGRTAMYGAPAVALGLAWLVRKTAFGFFTTPKWQRPATWLLQLPLACFLLWPSAAMSVRVSLSPVLDSSHALALRELGRQSPLTARVWSWWDYGYASLYFSRRLPFADGGQQGPEYVYVSGRVLAAHDAVQAAALMRYTASHGYAPWNVWHGKPPAEVEALIASPALLRQQLSREPESQYLVVGSDLLKLAPEILRLSAWSLSQGQLASPYCARLRQHHSVDLETGILSVRGQPKPVLLRRYVIMQQPGFAEYRFAHPSRLSLLSLPATGLNLLLDENAYSSMLVQLMLGKPEDIGLKRGFDLVYDDFPLSRIWKAKAAPVEMRLDEENFFRRE